MKPALIGGIFAVAVVAAISFTSNSHVDPQPGLTLGRLTQELPDPSSPDVAPNDVTASSASAAGQPAAGTRAAQRPAFDERELEADPSHFTVAVAPVVLATEDPRAIVAFEWVYASFLDQLAAIPHLDLVVLEAADQELMSEDADFYIETRGETVIVPNPVWTFRVSWSATRGGSGSWVATDDAVVPATMDAIPREATEALRYYPFPPEEAHVVALVGRALDPGTADPERLAAIDELERIPKRFELVGRDEQRLVSVAAVEIVASSLDPEMRARAWRAMLNANVDDPYLVAPAVDSLLMDPSDSVRFEAIRLLAHEFADNPNVRAAFEYVLMHDLSPAVRTQARWWLLDEQGRRQYVVGTLLNDKLSDRDRLELLSADIPGFDQAIDRQSAMALSEIARRAIPSSQSPADDDDERVNAVLVIPLLSQLLTTSKVEQIRSSAASALLRHIDEPGVRETLERAARSEPSSWLRLQIESGLQRAQIGSRFPAVN